jgi:hypothetical protein
LSDQTEREIGPPQLELHLGRLQQQAAACRTLRCELGGSLQRRGRNRRGPASQGSFRRRLKLGRDISVRPLARRCSVPRAAVRIRRVGVCESRMGRELGGRGRGAVDRSPYERVAEMHAGVAQLDESRRLRRLQVGGSHVPAAHHTRRLQDLPQACLFVQCGDEQDGPSRLRES